MDVGHRRLNPRGTLRGDRVAGAGTRRWVSWTEGRSWSSTTSPGFSGTRWPGCTADARSCGSVRFPWSTRSQSRKNVRKFRGSKVDARVRRNGGVALVHLNVVRASTKDLSQVDDVLSEPRLLLREARVPEPADVYGLRHVPALHSATHLLLAAGGLLALRVLGRLPAAAGALPLARGPRRYPGTRVVAARERLGAGPRRSCGTSGSARERTAPGRVAAPPRGADSSGGAATAGGRARSRGGALSESRGDAAGHRLRAGGSWS